MIRTHQRVRVYHWAAGVTLLATTLAGAQTQLPLVSSGGVVNAASYAQPIAPRSIVSIFGSNLASVTQSAETTPLPFEIAGTSVTWNGIKAPLFFVSPSQINLQVPSSLEGILDPSQTTFTNAAVVVTTSSGSSASVQVPLYDESPSVFSVDGSGCGRAAALNVATDGSVTLNSPENSAAPGDIISLFGTGLGQIWNPPPDGTPASIQNFKGGVGAWIDGESAYTLYAGPAPSLVGVDQVNVLIPSNAREGCSVPVTLIQSPQLTVSIHSGRGQCTDPPLATFGQAILAKTISTGTASDGEADSFTAVLSEAPGLQQAPPLQLGVFGLGWGNSYLTVVSRSCNVSGYTNPSAGTVAVFSQKTGSSQAVQPSGPPDGVTYQQTLPTGFVGTGSYTISGEGSPLSFRGDVVIPAPITLQSTFPPGAGVPGDQPLTITWAGGQPGTKVTVTVTALRGVANQYQIASGDGSKGSLTFPCTRSNGFCYFGIVSSPKGQITVEYSSAAPTTILLPEASGQLQANWMYRWVFGGLTLVSGPQ
ncbi:MAG: hypothetical protein ABI693_06440 [Bryobacteraceae bacterium]